MAPRLEPGARSSGPLIQGFRGGGFVVDDAAYAALWLTPERAGEWTPPAIERLSIEHLAAPLDLGRPPEFLLLGTGPTLRFPPPALTAALDDRGIGIEAMDSRAAARAWAMLRSEQRWIVAALMPL